MAQRLWTVALSAFAAVALAGPVAAAPIPAENKGDGAVPKARKALEQKITAKADGKTLTEAVELLKEVAKVEIILDLNTIQMLGVDPNQPVIKFDFKDVKLKDGLRTAFAAMNLRCGVTSSGIVVSTDEGLTIRQLRQRVNIDADGKSLAETLKELADETGANVVIDPRAKKTADEKITLKIDDVPLESAVRLAADMGGLAVVRMSNVLFVTTEARADKLRPDADRPLGPTPGNPVFGGIDNIGPGGAPGLPPPPGANPAVLPPVVEATPQEKK